MTHQNVELVMWDTVKSDCKYPEDDNNNGYIYGVYLLDEYACDILDVTWYKTEKERQKGIQNIENAHIINP